MKKKLNIIIISIAAIALIVILFMLFINSKKELKLKTDKYSINESKDGTSIYYDRGFYLDEYNEVNSTYKYTIASGFHSSGGYDIKIVELNIDNDNNVKCIVEETTPNGATTQAYTYPICKITFYVKPKSIEVSTINGEKLSYLGERKVILNLYNKQTQKIEKTFILPENNKETYLCRAYESNFRMEYMDKSFNQNMIQDNNFIIEWEIIIDNDIKIQGNNTTNDLLYIYSKTGDKIVIKNENEKFKNLLKDYF